MKYENIKSIILTILVLTSLLLTWNLWTYQPSYEVLEKTNIVQEVSLSAKKDKKDIVKPDKIIFHLEDNYYGIVAEKEIETVIDEISHWNFDHFSSLNEEIDYSLVENNEVVEILYPGLIPINLYKNILSIKDKDYPNFSFDQIVINTEAKQKETSVVYFISRQGQRAYKSTVASSFIADFKERHSEQVKQYNKYFSFKTGSGRTFFLPINETEVMSYQYLSKPLDSEKFINALFSDPSLVQKNYIVTGEEYTDGSSLMRENNDTNMINYVDPAEVENEVNNSNDLLNRSIDFVNEHGGWTDNYHFVGLDNDEKTALFRLYETDGYPVFSENSPISEIRLVWGGSDISRYLRSNFTLGLETTKHKVTLISGDQALQSIQQSDQYNPDLLEDVTIGYQMKKDPQSLIIHLEPSWYYLYDGVWKQLTLGNLGGEKLGLE